MEEKSKGGIIQQNTQVQVQTNPIFEQKDKVITTTTKITYNTTVSGGNPFLQGSQESNAANPFFKKPNEEPSSSGNEQSMNPFLSRINNQPTTNNPFLPATQQNQSNNPFLRQNNDSSQNQQKETGAQNPFLKMTENKTTLLQRLKKSMANHLVIGAIAGVSYFAGLKQNNSNALNDSFDLATTTISQTKQSGDLLTAFTTTYKENITEAGLEGFEGYSQALSKGLDDYYKEAGDNTKDAKDMEKSRSIFVILLLVYFIVVIGLSVVGYFIKLDWLVMIMGLLVFISIPGVLVFDGYMTKFFFYYGDLVSYYFY